MTVIESSQVIVWLSLIRNTGVNILYNCISSTPLWCSVGKIGIKMVDKDADITNDPDA